MSDRLTLATATGLPFLLLLFHFATGLVALVAGFVAIAVRKGGEWHRRSGKVFAAAMIATGITAWIVAAVEGKPGAAGGWTIVYFVVTALAAVRPLPGFSRPLDVALMVLALLMASLGYVHGAAALGRPGNRIDGVPAAMIFFMATMLLFAAIGDFRMIRAGGLQGARRLARHLWRMCFALFIASGSFLLGQMQFIPAPVRSVPLLFALAVSPLVVLLYWMWRVRVRRDLRGMMTAKPIDSAR